MKLWKVTIEARSPLVFPIRKPGEQFRESLPFVPGATLYGALGGAGVDTALLERVRCYNAYPAAPGDPWARPLPLTAAAPKGARPRANAPRTFDAKPADTLIDRVCWELMRPAALIYAPTDGEGRGWKGAAGCYAPPQSGDLRGQTSRRVAQRVMTRVSINRRRGTAEEQRLYSFLAISEVNQFTRYAWNDQGQEQGVSGPFATLFLGGAAGPDDLDLAPLLEKIDQIGGRLTTGMGLVSLTAEPAAPDDGAAVLERIRRMNQRFRRSAARYERLGPAETWRPTGDLFTINLLSDAILREQRWRPTTILGADVLREAAGLRTADLRLLRSFALPGIAGGWNVVWPGHKPTSVSTAAGAVFVFQAPGGLAEGDAARLAQLQLEGIGDRRPEGYGQVRICDDFHIDPAYALDYAQFVEEQA